MKNLGLNILQDTSSEHSSVRRLQPQDTKKGTPKINNKPVDEVVIEELRGRVPGFLKRDLEAKPWSTKEDHKKHPTALTVD